MKLSYALDIAASVKATDRQVAEGCVKIQEDLDRYRIVIDNSDPELVIECGTHAGGSAKWFAAQGLDVVTVDTSPYAKFEHDRIRFVTGNTADPMVVEKVALIAEKYDRVMVSLDSDHSWHHVEAEIIQYGPLVSSGCYMVVEDGIIRWFSDYSTGPLDAVEKLLADNPLWTRDMLIENMYPVTMHPGGWWRKNGN